jgi:hypothetical protein
MTRSAADERCVLRRQPAGLEQGGSLLCMLRDEHLHKLGLLCAACREPETRRSSVGQRRMGCG